MDPNEKFRLDAVVVAVVGDVTAAGVVVTVAVAGGEEMAVVVAKETGLNPVDAVVVARGDLAPKENDELVVVAVVVVVVAAPKLKVGLGIFPASVTTGTLIKVGMVSFLGSSFAASDFESSLSKAESNFSTLLSSRLRSCSKSLVEAILGEVFSTFSVVSSDSF